MHPTDDSTLLRQYVETRSDEAFATLVARHINLVYSVAVRCVGDPHQAEEIAQSVFILLANKAATLRHDKALSSWLFQTTRLTASNFIRSETRRHRRELEAHMQSQLDQPDRDLWQRIAPLLDDAVAELSDPDRRAILLRFYEGRSLREVGIALDASEDAAQKRLTRAVEQLRDFFAKQGVTVGASGLVAIIGSNAVQAAPVGLAVTITTAATLGGTTIATAAATTAKAITMTTLQKSLIGATLFAAIGTGIYEARQASIARKQVEALRQQQASLATQVEELARERDDAARQMAAMRNDGEQLIHATSELLKLRSEVARLRDAQRQTEPRKPTEANDQTTIAALAWVNRAKLLKARFEQWPGRATPEMQLLSEQDWLNEAANRELDTDEACREAISRLRWTAKGKFAVAVKTAIDQFTEANNGQLPSELSQLASYLKPPAESLLNGYEIAKPGWVKPPKPSSPNSERAESWAIVEKGNFTPDGIPIRDGSNLSDPDFDMYVVIYQGGHYGYGTGNARNRSN